MTSSDRDAADRARGPRDQAGVGPEPGQAAQLRPLSAMTKFQLAAGEPDIVGWTVCTPAGEEMGTVADLLVDTERNEVVLVDIALKGADRHTLAPLRAATIDRERKALVIASADVAGDVPALRPER